MHQYTVYRLLMNYISVWLKWAYIFPIYVYKWIYFTIIVHCNLYTIFKKKFNLHWVSPCVLSCYQNVIRIIFRLNNEQYNEIG